MAVCYVTSSIISFFLLFSFLVAGLDSAQLSSNFDATSCPKAISTIKSAVNSAVSNAANMEASLLRLHFHECFVNGCECDASILLDDVLETFTGEKTVVTNSNSLRGFDTINTIKSQLESLCPSVVSCVDILAVATRDSNIIALSGPNWSSQAVPLGRRGLLAGTKPKYGADNHVPAPPSCPNPITNIPGRGGDNCTKH